MSDKTVLNDNKIIFERSYEMVNQILSQMVFIQKFDDDK